MSASKISKISNGLPSDRTRVKVRNVVATSILISVALSSAACNRVRPPDDKTITRRIQAKLYHDATLKTRDISVIAQNGLVTLSGQVSSEDERALAEHLAAAEPGVKHVIDELAIVAPSPAAAPRAPTASAPKQSK
jgi:hypothetical protein